MMDSLPKKPVLMALRIPTGYAICFNEFYDVEPFVDKPYDEELKNAEYFTEDLLQILKMELIQGQWRIPKKPEKIIDLGWYPAGHPKGEYQLIEARVLGQHEWKPKTIATSRDRHEVRDLLLTLMHL